MLLELLAAAVITNSNPILENIEPEIKIEQVEPTIEEFKELTVEEKVAVNHYKCDEAVQYIRQDNAECLDKLIAPVVVVQTSRSTNTQVSRQSSPQPTVRGSVSGNTYGYGYCTAYVKNQLSWVPNGWGNANRWASNARSQGFTVSNTPIVGAVAQTSSGGLGHVAVVVAVNGATVTVSEMNYNGWNVVSTRTVQASDFLYIY